MGHFVCACVHVMMRLCVGEIVGYACMYVCIYVCMRACIHVCIYGCMYAHVRAHLCACCVHIFICAIMLLCNVVDLNVFDQCTHKHRYAYAYICAVRSFCDIFHENFVSVER